MKKTIFLFILVLVSLGLGLLSQSKLDPLEQQVKIVALRDEAIQRAVNRGDYHCCINPPCTMCYMEANPWNNHTPGTCACDDLIAQGKQACPQCQNALCQSEANPSCSD